MALYLSDEEVATVRQTLRDLVAIERDRCLGFPASELHREPRAVLKEADETFRALETDPEEVIFPDDRETLFE